MRTVKNYTSIKKFLEKDELLRYAPSIFTEKPKFDVSDQYTFVKTIDVIEAIQDSGWYPVSVCEQGARKTENAGFQKHLVRFTRPQDLNSFAQRIEIVLFNSHNRSVSFQLKIGIFRLVCANGMVVGDDFMEYKQRHIGFDFENLYSQIKQIQEMSNKLTDKIDVWNRINLTRTEQQFYANNAINSVYDIDNIENPFILPESILKPRRYEDSVRKPSLWTTYNIVQESLTKGGVPTTNKTKKGKSTRTREIRNIDRDIRTNQRLWDVTEEMARLAA